MPDDLGLVDEARQRAKSYRIGGPSSEHTAALLNSLASAIERLLAEREEARKADDRERCIASDMVLKAGQLVLPDASGGMIHAACCGPERESYVNSDGDPLGPDDPIPTGSPWADPAEAVEGERKRLKEALEYAAMGLGRIHDSLSSNGPKQASGEMTAHFMTRARQALQDKP